MNGRIISGAYGDPEITRLEAEINRLTRSGASNAAGAWLKSGGNSAALSQLQAMLESRKRIAQKRAALDDTGLDRSTAMDVVNARREAKDLAARMKAGGYTRAQIADAVRSMLVNPSGTMTGKKERQARRAKRKARREERKKAGKGIFRKIGKAIAKGAAFVYKGVAKLNPALAIGRTATLDLVRRNAGGIATKMQRGGSDKARKKWEHLGGNWDKLKAAIEKGSGQRMTGFYPITGPEEDDKEEAPKEEKKDFLDKLFAMAKPILKVILGAFGVKFDPQPDGTSKVRIEGGSAADRELKKQLDRAYSTISPEEAAIDKQAQDALNPNTGGGAGYNGGGAAISPLVWAGIAAVAILVLRK